MRLDDPTTGGIFEQTIPSSGKAIFPVPLVAQPLEHGASLLQQLKVRDDRQKIDDRFCQDSLDRRRTNVMDHLQ